MNSLYRDSIFACDERELGLGDVLDVKAGILLALIAVLGAISSTLLADSHLLKKVEIMQIASLVMIAVGASSAFWALLPRTYWMPGLPSVLAPWFEGIMTSSDPGTEESRIEEGFLSGAKERVEFNHKINALKSRWMVIAFWPTMIALLLDLASLGLTVAAKFLS